MKHTLGHRKSLLWIEFDSAALQINDKPALHNIEELVFFVMFVPVKLALHDAKPNHAIVDLAQRLVEPLFLRFLLKPIDINELQGLEHYMGMN